MIGWQAGLPGSVGLLGQRSESMVKAPAFSVLAHDRFAGSDVAGDTRRRAFLPWNKYKERGAALV